MGLVSQVFDEEDLRHLPGNIAIGHNRYSTTGSSRIKNAQPFRVQGPNGEIALAHNGNLVNTDILRADLEEEGHEFTTTTDSEVMARILAHAPGRTWEERFAHMMRRVQGAYCLVVLTPDELLVARDPLGVRPLCLGRFNGGWAVASESCAFDHLGATFLREIAPGEVVQIDAAGVRSFSPLDDRQSAFCIFEYIY
jgi:amidophosphoribosyltransferase